MSADQNLGLNGARSALVGSSGQLIKLVINMVSLIVLSRILAPEDYGLTALAFAIIGVAELIRDLGLSTASIQAKHLPTAERDNLWWANTLLGLGCTLVCCALAPLIGWIFHDSRLILITICISFVFALSGMATQFRCDLIRKLQYGRLTSWETASALISLAAAISIAFAGGGYWALIAQQLINNLLVLGGNALMAGWLPGAIDRSTSIRKFFHYGFPLFGSSVLTYFSGNLDTILIGKFFGNTVLGSYNRAIQMVRMPMNQIRNPLGNVALSTLAKVREDKSRYESMLLKAQALYLYPIVAIALLIAFGSENIIHFLLGSKWEQSIPLVAILAFGDALTSLSSVAGWIYLSEAKSGALFRLTIYSTVLRIALFCAAIPFGVTYVAAVYIATGAIMWPATFIHCQKTTGFHTLPMFWVSLRAFLSLFAAGGIAYAGTRYLELTSHFLAILVLMAIFAVSFIAICAILPPVRKDARYVGQTFQKVLSK